MPAHEGIIFFLVCFLLLTGLVY